MAEKLGQQRLVVRQRHHAVTQVARRQHIEVPPQASARAAIVGYGHHRCQVADQTRHSCRVGFARLRRRCIAAQSAQQRGQPGAPTDRHHAQRRPPVRGCSCCLLLSQRAVWNHRHNYCGFLFFIELPGLLNFRIKQLREPRIVRHVLKIRVHARMNAVLWIDADGRGQVF